MNRMIAIRLMLAVVAIAVVAAVGVVGYNWGLSTGQGQHTAAPFYGHRGWAMGHDMPGLGYGDHDAMMSTGLGFLGWLGLLLIGALLVLLVVGLATGSGRAAAAAGGSGVERLGELSDMHTRGELTDPEFEAAKRKLLGL